MLRTFIQITALTLTLEAAIFLARGNLGLSVEAIAQLARTGWVYNLDVASSLSHQRADTWIGVILLLAAFGLQMGNTLWPVRWKDFGVSRLGAVLAVLVSALVLMGVFMLSARLVAGTETRVRELLKSSQASEDLPKHLTK